MLNSILPISLTNSAQAAPAAEGPSSKARLLQFPSEPSTLNLVHLAQSGDEDAFTALYLQSKKSVFLICMRMVRDHSLADDLTQETFLQVHRKFASFRGDSAFATWLHRLAVNTVLMHLRKRGLSLVSLDYLMTDVPEERAGRSFGTRDMMQAGVVDRLTISRAVANLPPGYRSIFLLHDVEGFLHDEIADMLKCTRGNTKSQLHKARRALRGALSEQARSDRRSAKLVKEWSAARPVKRSTGRSAVLAGESLVQA